MNAIFKVSALMLIPALAMANGSPSHAVLDFLPDLNKIVVDAAFSGGDTVEFIVDNGAQFSVIDSSFESRFEWLDNIVVGSMGVDGGISVVSTVLIDSLWVGDIVATDLGVASIDLSYLSEGFEFDVAGLLGTDFLSDFAWTLDYSSHKIILDKLKENGGLLDPKAATSISREPTYSIGFERQLHLLRTTAQFSDGVFGNIALDCGIQGGVISPEIFSKIPEAAYLLVGTDTLIDADKNSIPIPNIILRDFAIGPVARSDYLILVVDLSGGEFGGLNIDGVIGYDFFQDWLITTRFDKKVIELRPIPK
ncbi:aspartyl protease family protein [bacterium]|nr:aspartyl protease family protein [bacterium]